MDKLEYKSKNMLKANISNIETSHINIKYFNNVKLIVSLPTSNKLSYDVGIPVNGFTEWCPTAQFKQLIYIHPLQPPLLTTLGQINEIALVEWMDGSIGWTSDTTHIIEEYISFFTLKLPMKIYSDFTGKLNNISYKDIGATVKIQSRSFICHHECPTNFSFQMNVQSIVIQDTKVDYLLPSEPLFYSYLQFNRWTGSYKTLKDIQILFFKTHQLNHLDIYNPSFLWYSSFSQSSIISKWMQLHINIIVSLTAFIRRAIIQKLVLFVLLKKLSHIKHIEVFTFEVRQLIKRYMSLSFTLNLINYVEKLKIHPNCIRFQADEDLSEYRINIFKSKITEQSFLIPLVNKLDIEDHIMLSIKSTITYDESNPLFIPYCDEFDVWNTEIPNLVTGIINTKHPLTKHLSTEVNTSVDRVKTLRSKQTKSKLDPDIQYVLNNFKKNGRTPTLSEFTNIVNKY